MEPGRVGLGRKSVGNKLHYVWRLQPTTQAVDALHHRCIIARPGGSSLLLLAAMTKVVAAAAAERPTSTWF